MCGSGPSSTDIYRQQAKERARLEIESELARYTENLKTLAAKRMSVENAFRQKQAQDMVFASLNDEEETNQPLGG